jgi:hypothetical protein
MAMRKNISIYYLLMICLVMVFSAGCASSPETKSTTPGSTLPRTTQPTTSTITNDEKFITEAATISNELAIATDIFHNAVTEMDTGIENAQLAETAYQNAVADLQQEQANLNALQTEYLLAVEKAGSDVAAVQYLKSEYDPAITAQKTRVTDAQSMVDKYDTARKNAIEPIDFKANGIDITLLRTTSQKGIDLLTPVAVPVDLQPVKDQYLAALSSYKKAGDQFSTAVTYYNDGKLTECTTAINQSSATVQAGNNQMDIYRIKLQQYENKIGSQ